MSHLVAILDPRAQIHVASGALEVRRAEGATELMHPHQIRELHLYGDASLTTAARNLLMREGIDVVFLTAAGRYRGRLVSSESRAGERRLAQYAALHDPARRLALARDIVAGKLGNQRRMLLRRQQSLKDEAIADVIVALHRSHQSSSTAADLDALRGVEGYGARVYFEGLARAITNPAFTFTGRNRNPPRDPVNACLSFGYALAQVQVEHATRASGLDPYLGALHEPGRGAPCLALDLLEELRPLVDSLVLTLINRRQLSPEDFRRPTEEELQGGSTDEGEAVYLADAGRAVVLREWERTLTQPSPHPQTGEQWTLRDLIREQTAQVARVFEGRALEYQPLQLGGV